MNQQQQLHMVVPVKNWKGRVCYSHSIATQNGHIITMHTSKRNRTRRRGINIEGGLLRMMSRERGRAVMPRTGHNRGWTNMSLANRPSINASI